MTARAPPAVDVTNGFGATAFACQGLAEPSAFAVVWVDVPLPQLRRDKELPEESGKPEGSEGWCRRRESNPHGG